jgi:hypothetical protein
MPANPNSDGQKIQRGLFGKCVAFAKVLVGPVFNTYTDRLTASMSGFNAFIKANITYFTSTPSFNLLKITAGKLFLASGVYGTYETGTGDTVVTFGSALGNNGLATDKVYAFVYHVPTGLFYFPDSEVERSGGAIAMPTLPTGLTPGDIREYVFAVRKHNGIVTMISDSQTNVLTA